MFAQQAHVGADANEKVATGVQNRLPKFVTHESRSATQQCVFWEFFLPAGFA
jgi:hypothetical protein